jgi:hypothetical protein
MSEDKVHVVKPRNTSVPLEVASMNAGEPDQRLNVGDLLKLAGAMQDDQPFHRFLDTGKCGEPGVSGGDGDDMTFEEWAAVSGHRHDTPRAGVGSRPISGDHRAACACHVYLRAGPSCLASSLQRSMVRMLPRRIGMEA